MGYIRLEKHKQDYNKVRFDYCYVDNCICHFL